MTERAFVKYRNDQPSPRPVLVNQQFGSQAHRPPTVTVIIPTADGNRGGYLPALLKQLESQTFQDFEILTVQGDNRQGRAINTAADRAEGRFLVTFDDDTRLGSPQVLERLVAGLEQNHDVGLAGGENRIPDDAPWLVRRFMAEVPRRSTAPVTTVTDSDLAEHPCFIIRKELFCRIGGENELIPRGLDPYLRQAVRESGFRVVVLPDIVYHHLPPARLDTIVRQFFRNGAQSRYCSRQFPQWVYETPGQHGPFEARRPLWFRVTRSLLGVGWALLTFRWVYAACQLSYWAGWLWEEFSARSSR